MKRLFVAGIISLLVAGTMSAQQKEVKKGFNIGPLPAISYSSDMGLQYGVIADMYQYGDGTVYPDYIYKINVEASAYTKGNRTLHAYFDSKHLIEGKRFSAGLSYFGNNTYPFYGFNGASSPYFEEMNGITDTGLGYYLMKRNMFRAMATLQGDINDSNWSWACGLTFYNIATGFADNKAITDPLNSLYTKYIGLGVIPLEEAEGGNHLEFKAGVSYDTRDHENNPSKGTSFELYTYGSYDMFQSRNHYLKLAAHFKQFYPIINDRLVFGYHLAFQGKIAGNTPYYMLPIIQTLNLKQINPEGLGSNTTVRGTLRNRLLGEGYAWSNFELRYTFLKFNFIGQYWRLALNPFFDAGMIVQPYRLEQQKNAMAEGLYTGDKETLHCSSGAGLHVIMNQNFNISAELAKCFNQNDGNTALTIALNYIF